MQRRPDAGTGRERDSGVPPAGDDHRKKIDRRLRKLQRDRGSLRLQEVYARRWFPGRAIDEDCLAEAAFLEWDYWRKMSETIAKVLGG
ncbi:DUF6890 family protein [Victivallis vadensis]|uniref:DUF6890 family protein n=1 Tax=Victivallis vadensis TaxID=172901 RepID=UPI003C6F7F99